MSPDSEESWLSNSMLVTSLISLQFVSGSQDMYFESAAAYSRVFVDDTSGLTGVLGVAQSLRAGLLACMLA